MILDLLDSKSRDGGGGVGGDVFSRLGGSGKRGRDEDPYDQYANRSAEKRPRDSLLEYLRRSAREAGVAKDFPPEPIDSSQVVDADGNVTASADITNYIGLIIGKSGRMQSEIQSITGLTMEINRETNTATFTGPLDQVEQGLSLIREVIETTNALREVRVGAPSQHRYDERSGRGGDLDRPREERPPRAPEPLREGEVAETLPITGHVGLIIGKQGANIKWMKKKSSCSIEVNREEETVDIRGSPDNVALAKRLIAETLEKSRNRAVAQQGEDEQMPQAESTETAE
jgi:rRNA processing protein Krr1/Pno1